MRILRQPEVVARVGLCPMTLWRREKAGTFPRRVKLGPNSVGWLETEVDEWIKRRIAERDAPARNSAAPEGIQIHQKEPAE